MHHSVLVAVDCRADGLDAVAWAAAEASARQASLHILHVIRWDPFGISSVGPGDAGEHDAARRFLDNAAERAGKIAPQLAIAAYLHTGDPARVIAIEGNHADLIVLGRDPTCRPHRLWARSVTRQVAARSQRPVTVVGLSGAPLRGPSAGRVVAAVSSDQGVAAAWAVLGAAFNAAHRRGVGVTVLADNPRDTARTETTMDDLLRQHREVFFDVDLQQQPLTGPRGSLLPRASRSAALVVLAAPDGPLARWRSGSTIGRLLQTIPAPITFVHNRPARLLGSRAGGSR
ncbi:universal stress protein [Kribbella sp. NPDC049174]|uniref:universal stress protein n=1 Tax=Kribbella sp. NPDC049174 TaxID=3364112 RepID=UPI003711FEB4